MNKLTTRLLSVLLCVALCCTALPAPAFAASGETGALYLGKVTVCKNAVSIKPPRYGY